MGLDALAIRLGVLFGVRCGVRWGVRSPRVGVLGVCSWLELYFTVIRPLLYISNQGLAYT